MSLTKKKKKAKKMNGPSDSYFDPPMGHKGECNCRGCHIQHVELGMFADYAEDPDYECCKTEMQEKEMSGEWCPFHGPHYMDEGTCLKCLTPSC